MKQIRKLKLSQLSKNELEKSKKIEFLNFSKNSILLLANYLN